jgi:hypothetical protein
MTVAVRPTARVLLAGLAGCLLLVACSGPEVSRGETRRADVDEVRIGSPQSPPLRVRVTVRGFLTNGCERLQGVTQRLEGRTFFIEVLKVDAPPAGVPCHTGITEFQKEVVLEVGSLADGVYTVDVNGVKDTFELNGRGILVENGYASLEAVDVQVLAASPGTSAVIGVFVEGEFSDPCVDLRGVNQVREGNTFKLGLETPVRIDVACPPVPEFFWEFTLLEPQDLPPGTYQVEVDASNTVTASFELYPDTTYREPKVTEVMVVPTEGFAADVVVRGELQSSCEVIDGAIRRQSGTDRDMLTDSEFVISLVSRTPGSCSEEVVPFEKVVPIASYGSGSYTVTVNGVTETFDLP